LETDIPVKIMFLDTPDRKKAALAVAVDAFGKINKTDFRKTINHERVTFLGAYVQGMLVGIAGYFPSMASEHLYEMAYVCVAHAYRGRGIGRDIVLTAIMLIREQDRDAPVLVDALEPAFYRKCGAIQVYRGPPMLMLFKPLREITRK